MAFTRPLRYRASGRSCFTPSACSWWIRFCAASRWPRFRERGWPPNGATPCSRFCYPPGCWWCVWRFLFSRCEASSDGCFSCCRRCACWRRAYSDRGRPNPLVLVDTDDELYSAVLPLPKIHYCWIDPNGLVERLVPYYVELGITVTAAQFDDIEHWEPIFRERLRAWGLNSSEPIATAVVAQSDADVAKIVAAHSTADFYLPARFRAVLEGAVKTTHELV